MNKFLSGVRDVFYVSLFFGTFLWVGSFFKFGEYNPVRQYDCYKNEIRFSNLEDSISNLDGVKNFSKIERYYLDSLAGVLDKGEDYRYSFEDKMRALKNSSIKFKN